MNSRHLLIWLACLGLLALAPALESTALAEEILLWHAYRGDEKQAIEQVVHDYETLTGNTVRVLAVPDEGYTNKLVTAIPRGNGPDVFIAAHDQTGSWSENKIISPLGSDDLPEALLDDFHPQTVEALRYKGDLYGLPVAFKSSVLFYNKKLVSQPPKDTVELMAMVEALTNPEAQKYGLVYEITNLYFHSTWLHGFGGHIFDPDTGAIDLGTEENAASFEFARRLSVFLPHDVDGARISKLFNDGDAAMVINGPWFMAQLGEDLDYGVAVLPFVTESQQWAAPFLTAEGLFLSSEAHNRKASLELLTYIACEGALTRATLGKQMVAYLPTYEPGVLNDSPAAAERRAVFLAQLDHVVPTSNRPEMSSVWAPTQQALRKALYGAPSGATPYWMLVIIALLAVGVVFMLKAHDVRTGLRRPSFMLIGLLVCASAIPVIWHLFTIHSDDTAVDPLTTLREAQTRIEVVQAPAAIQANPAPFVALFGLVMLILAGLAYRAYQKNKKRGVEYTDTKVAAFYVAPATIGMFTLVIAPFLVGTALSLFSYERGEFIFVGLQNFARLFSGEGTPLTDSLSFYFTLVVTILWTGLNVFLHVTIGLTLALILREPWLKLRGFFRVLLIIPWAIPNYITALIWRGMFDYEFGAINGILKNIGLTPVAWFDDFITSFSANLITNTWLGFPFMMVVTLGALQAIPRDLEDAAAVDGASAWQRFRFITMPLLKPALMPAVVLGSVWTFNMFNIIYLVSQGNPDSSTEILISEAYKWAFERQYQYGYAAAYAIIVFFILVVYSRMTSRILEADA